MSSSEKRENLNCITRSWNIIRNNINRAFSLFLGYAIDRHDARTQVQATCKGDALPFLGKASEIDVFVSCRDMGFSISNEFVRYVVPKLMSFVENLTEPTKQFTIESSNKRKSTKKVVATKKKRVTPIHVHLDTVLRLRVLDTLNAIPKRKNREHFLLIEMRPKLRLSLEGPTTSMDLSISTCFLEQMLRMNEKIDRQYILSHKSGTKFCAVSLSRRAYVSPNRNDRVRARFQISPIFVRGVRV